MSCVGGGRTIIIDRLATQMGGNQAAIHAPSVAVAADFGAQHEHGRPYQTRRSRCPTLGPPYSVWAGRHPAAA